MNRKYKTLLIDPPWNYGVWGKASIPRSKNHIPKEEPMPYKTMSVKEISNLPIQEISDIDCELYLWTTQKYLPAVFEILNKWGFKYCQTLIWCKNPMGKGQGGIYTPTNEFLILGRKGKMPKFERIDTTWFNIKRTNKHSKKPIFFYELIEKVTNQPRAELFARNKRVGWDSWGNEVECDFRFNELSLENNSEIGDKK